MRNAVLFSGLFVALTVGLVLTQQRSADAAQVPSVQLEAATTQASEPAPSFDWEVDSMAKRCSFNSDCSHGNCKQGRCGGCSFNSDCKGWGKCSNGWCGACSFASECKGFGSCSSGKCTKSPY